MRYRMPQLKILYTALFGIGLMLALSPVANHAAEKTKTPPASTVKVPVPTKIKPLDINSAGIDDLKALPGIHYVYAEKIIAGRPYQKKDELVSREIIPEATYNKIKDRIITVNATGN